MENKQKIEILIASLFVVSLLLFTTLIFIKDSSNLNYSSNSIAIQTINQPSKIVRCDVQRTPYQVKYNTGETTKTTIVKSTKLSYTDTSNSYTKEGLFSNGIQVYEVKIKNTGCASGYFKVEMYLVNSHGNTQTEFMRKYIKKDGESTFSYTNLNREKQITSWTYKTTADDSSCVNTGARYTQITTPRTALKTNYITELECLKI